MLLATLSIVVAAVPTAAETTSSITPELAVSAGYDSDAYLDAAALPAGGLAATGALLRVAPLLAGTVHLPAAQRVQIGYAAEVDQYLAGDVEGETALRHRVSAGYVAPPFGDFKLSVSAAFAQTAFREIDAGWLQGRGRLALRRAFGSSVRAQLAYEPTFTDYESGDVVAEWTHQLQVSLAWASSGGWLIEPYYALVFSRTDPAAFDSLHHRPGVVFRWAPPSLRLSLSGRYELTVLGFEQSDPGSSGSSGARGMGRGGRVVAATSRTDVVHRVAARLQVGLWRGSFAFVGYEGAFGSSSADGVDDYTRHVALGGVGLSLELGWPPPRADERRHTDAAQPGAGLTIALHLPQARRVAAVGTFNGWDPQRGALQMRGGGRWSRTFTLPAGHHRYMIWVDGSIRAPRDCQSWADDGFGGKNCAISTPSGS